jgi:hypothetical protein
MPTPGDYDDGEVGWMIIGRGNRSTRRKSSAVPLFPTHPPHPLLGREFEQPRGKPVRGLVTVFRSIDEIGIETVLSCTDFKIVYIPKIVFLKSSVFLDTMPCSPLKLNWRFGATCHSPPKQETSVKQVASKPDLRSWRRRRHFLRNVGLGEIFLRNVDWISRDYTASYARRWTLPAVAANSFGTNGVSFAYMIYKFLRLYFLETFRGVIKTV